MLNHTIDRILQTKSAQTIQWAQYFDGARREYARRHVAPWTAKIIPLKQGFHTPTS